MVDEAIDLRERKLEHIKRDYDRACSLASRLDDRIKSIRTWNITLIVAYMGWTTRPEGNNDIQPLLGAICLFWLMEALARASARFYGQQTLAQADRVFSRKTMDQFNLAVDKYVFLDMAKCSPLKKWFSTKGKVHRLLSGFLGLETLAFYFLPLLILAESTAHKWIWRIVLSCLFAIGLGVWLGYEKRFRRRIWGRMREYWTRLCANVKKTFARMTGWLRRRGN